MEDGDAELDEENAVQSEEGATRASSETAADEEIVGNSSVFTFSDVNYTVKVKGGTRDLLQGVQGWVRPGKLTALVGGMFKRVRLSPVLTLRHSFWCWQG
jgi:ATP-binding cassette subfamily G (WHITE) protein 2 (SNQ2)